MTNLVLTNGGLLDKYVGDAIMAVFGIPVYKSDHSIKACLTAIDMIEDMKKLNAEFEAKGFPKFNIGIGINTGPMIVGNIGSKNRFNYTVIGDSVNLASRIEGLNKEFGTNIIISESTYNEVKDFLVCRELGPVKGKGKGEKVRIYELVGKKGANRNII